MARSATGQRALRLRELLGSSSASEEEERFVVEQLESRQAGLESLAARVLATWRRPRDKEQLRAWIGSRLLHQNVGFRPDLVTIFRAFEDPADSDWLLQLFRNSPRLRSSMSHALRDLAHGPRLARALLMNEEPQLSIDVIRGFMWSRRRYGKALELLANHSNQQVRSAARENLSLFERFPSQYP